MTWTSGVGRACSVLLDAIVRLLALSRINPNVDRKSTRLNSSHSQISYAVFCLKKKKTYSQSVSAEQLYGNTGLDAVDTSTSHLAAISRLLPFESPKVDNAMCLTT